MLKNKIQGCYPTAFFFFPQAYNKKNKLKLRYMIQSTAQKAYQAIWKSVLYKWVFGIIETTDSQTNLTWSHSKPCAERCINFPY